MNPSHSKAPQWICLTGFMGSGKTTVGRELARALGWRFVDLDAEIVAHERRPIADIFRNDGEPRFRQIESDVFAQTLRSQPPAVIALGGGTFIQAGNRELLRSQAAVTVHLDAEFDLLNARCCTEEGVRPLMQDPVHFRNLFEQRRPVYRSAEIVVEIAGKSPGDVATEILTQVQRWKTREPVPE